MKQSNNEIKRADVIEATDDMFLASAYRLLQSGSITRTQYDTVLRRAAINRIKR